MVTNGKVGRGGSLGTSPTDTAPSRLGVGLRARVKIPLPKPLPDPQPGPEPGPEPEPEPKPESKPEPNPESEPDP